MRSTLELPAAGNQFADLPAGSIAEVAQTVLPSVVKLQIQAVVRVRNVSDLAVAELGRSSDLVVGQQVVAVGRRWVCKGR